ncbi:unnamed protein product [Trypanosoma congolense IL3000]|uniref:WGS project CAEQ00000000 data, annotated contig 1770 n=1 Tax=Trypanosoma congolense (strain IL3000) TaxID=1068625 RepID=F9W8R9_TRYCI|nr:unnamed protein product [Trypanosoma congolense IL3000]
MLTKAHQIFSAKIFHGSKVNDAQQESRDVISQELRSMGAAFSGYPQPPFFAGLPEAVFSICGYYPIYTGKGCHDVGNSSVADTLTANGNYSAPKGVDLPPAPGRYSRRQLYVNGLDENATTGRGVSVPAPENNVENTRDKPKEGMTDNDDDDDVIKMLYDIREAAHIELTPHKVSAETFYRGSVITSSPYSELVSNTVVSDNSVSNDSLPAPSVTISQSEREALRSLQQVFLAHMRHSGSPDRTPPEVPSSGSVWRSFVGNERLSDSQGWIGEQNARDEGDRFWHSTNRTLFSYQTDPHERNAHKAMTKSTEWNMSVEPGEVLVHSPYRRRGSEASLTDEQLSLSLPKARTNNLLDEEKPISHPASREDGCTFHPLGKSVTASRIPLASLSVNEGVEASETCCRWSSSTVPGFLPVAKGLHMTNARGLWPSNTRLTANYRDGPDSQRGGKYYTNGSEKCEVQHAAA